jgi:hypothetical protein
VTHSGKECHRDVLAVLMDPEVMLRLDAPRVDGALRVLRRARLLGRVACRAEQFGLLGQLSPLVQDQLTSAIVVADARARGARWEMNRLALALRDLPDVPVIAMKGCGYLLVGTPNADGRLFADVDLMVP